MVGKPKNNLHFFIHVLSMGSYKCMFLCIITHKSLYGFCSFSISWDFSMIKNTALNMKCTWTFGDSDGDGDGDDDGEGHVFDKFDDCITYWQSKGKLNQRQKWKCVSHPLYNACKRCNPHSNIFVIIGWNGNSHSNYNLVNNLFSWTWRMPNDSCISVLSSWPNSQCRCVTRKQPHP